MTDTFYVAENGDDQAPGTRAKPFATLARACAAARESRRPTVAHSHAPHANGDYLPAATRTGEVAV